MNEPDWESPTYPKDATSFPSSLSRRTSRSAPQQFAVRPTRRSTRSTTSSPCSRSADGLAAAAFQAVSSKSWPSHEHSSPSRNCCSSTNPLKAIQPSILDEIAEAIDHINLARGITVLVVEQNLDFAARIAERGLIMDKGEIIENVAIAELHDDRDLQRTFLAL